jgi:peroxiredoxin
LSLVFLFLLPLYSVGAEKEQPLVGEEAPYFSLPSTQDRLISYVNEYYGKHHLIITFFPAAFTPT